MNETEAKQYHDEQMRSSDWYAQTFQSSLHQVFDMSLIGRSKEGLQGRNFLATAGFTHVGKTTVARGLQERIPGLVKVETNIIHDVTNANFPQLQDDNTITGTGFWLRNIMSADMRDKIIRELCRDKLWIIHDGANLKKSERDTRFQIPKEFDYKTVLLWLNIPEKVINLLQTKRKLNIYSIDNTEKNTLIKELQLKN